MYVFKRGKGSIKWNGLLLVIQFNTTSLQNFHVFWREKEKNESLTVTKKPVQVKFVPKIRNKYRKHWKNYVSFQLSWQTRLIWALLLNFCNFAKVSYIFSCFQVRTKKLIKMNMKKMTFLHSKYIPYALHYNPLLIIRGGF